MRQEIVNLGGKYMETWYYEVVSIDGDYANLKRCDIESDDLKLWQGHCSHRKSWREAD